ncbi:hypothetical protein ADT25_20625 [Xanthomonas oryzae]|uniref:Uncharacterized protein n=1 Tax=Xanthomonas oryzae TaxID=347 RepID=A0AAP1EX84_9XANT|nr:hypothetical protein ADT25_20625 [Xanthomonas oryzae]
MRGFARTLIGFLRGAFFHVTRVGGSLDRTLRQLALGFSERLAEAQHFRFSAHAHTHALGPDRPAAADDDAFLCLSAYWGIPMRLLHRRACRGLMAKTVVLLMVVYHH